jgi:hypothetical protein
MSGIISTRGDFQSQSSKVKPLTTLDPIAQITGIATATPAVLTASGAVGASTLAARADHSHPTTGLMLTTHAAYSIAGFGTTAVALGIAGPGTSTLVSRADHVHPTTGLVLHSLATAANDFLIASGAGSFIRRSLAETQSILGLGSAAYTNHDTAATGAEHGATAANTASAIMRRDSAGDVNVRLLRSEYTAGGGTNAYFLTQNAVGSGQDNYARPMTLASVQASVVTKASVESVLTGVIASHSHTSVPNIPTSDVGGNIWIS